MCVVLIFCIVDDFFAAAAFWRLNLGPARLRFFLGMSSLIRDPVRNCRNFPQCCVCCRLFSTHAPSLSLSLSVCSHSTRAAAPTAPYTYMYHYCFYMHRNVDSLFWRFSLNSNEILRTIQQCAFSCAQHPLACACAYTERQRTFAS